MNKMTKMNQLKCIICPAIFLLIPAISSMLSLPQPDFQAVCRVTLKSGDIHEGFILIGRGDQNDHSAIWMSGFHLGGQRYYFLTLDFVAFEKTEPNYVEITGVKEGMSKRRKRPTAFLSWSSSKIHGSMKTIDDDSGKSRYFVRREQVEIRYQISDTLKLLQDPITGYHPQTIVVRIRDISRLELLKYPGQVWLDKIAKNRKQFYIEDTSCDYVAPVWYHELHQGGGVDRYRKYQKNLVEFRTSAYYGFDY